MVAFLISLLVTDDVIPIYVHHQLFYNDDYSNNRNDDDNDNK